MSLFKKYLFSTKVNPCMHLTTSLSAGGSFNMKFSGKFPNKLLDLYSYLQLWFSFHLFKARLRSFFCCILQSRLHHIEENPPFCRQVKISSNPDSCTFSYAFWVPHPPPPPHSEQTGIFDTPLSKWERAFQCKPFVKLSIFLLGYAGGQYYDHTGGMSNTVCLHSKPNFEKYSDSIDTAQYIYGLEYEVSMFSPFKTAGLHNKDAPCSVCEVETRGTQIMIPGRNVCPTGWTLEYKGYLMSAHYGHKGRSTAVCVDNDAEGFPRSEKDQNGNLWYTIQASCGSLPCGPYIQGRELTCAVCTI